MKDLIISTEAACDISTELIEKYNIKIAPMKFLINGVEFRSDDKEFSTEQVCKFMKEGATSKTSQITEFEAKEFFELLLQEGKDILHISFSGAMSTTADNFKRAAKTLNESNNNKIYVVDSLCQSGGVGLLIKLVAERIESDNLSASQAFDFAESIKLNIAHFFTVDDLKYLARGGRISSTSAFIGNIIKIKPVLHLNDEGVIVQFQKVISRKKALATLIEQLKQHINHNYKFAFISEADANAEANEIANTLKNELDIETTIVPLGAVVCSHSGPGTLALFFVSDKR